MLRRAAHAEVNDSVCKEARYHTASKSENEQRVASLLSWNSPKPYAGFSHSHTLFLLSREPRKAPAATFVMQTSAPGLHAWREVTELESSTLSQSAQGAEGEVGGRGRCVCVEIHASHL